MKNNKKRGFTLVELLVVIAILAILATVSVVGYTSFIEGASLQVDEDLATQLNHFLEAYKVNNREDITEDNVWYVTNELLELGGLDELQTQTDGYHFFFKFDGQGGGEYVVASAKDIINKAGMHIMWNAIAGNEDDLKPGFFMFNEELYFLVDTTGTPVAEATRGFYTFDFITADVIAEYNATDKFDAFQKIVAGLTSDLQNIKDAAQQSVFVTIDGTKYLSATGNTNYVFHIEDGIIMEESVAVELSDAVSVPKNVTTFEVGAFNVTYTGNGMLVFETSSSALKDALCEDSLPNGIKIKADGKEWTYMSATYEEDAKITTGSETVYIHIGNPLQDFEMLISGTKGKLQNVTDNTLEYDAVLLWDGKTFKLGLDPKSLVAESNEKSLSSKRVKWELTDVDGNAKDADGNPITYDGVSLVNGVITLGVDVDGLYPDQTRYFYVTATAAHPLSNGTYAHKTFKVLLSRPNYVSVTVEGTATGNTNKANGTANVTYAETLEGIEDTFSVGAVFTPSKDNCDNYFDGATYSANLTITQVGAGVEKVDGGIKILSKFFPEDSTDDTIVTTITVRIGSYLEYDIDLSVYNAKYMFGKVNLGNISTLGTDGNTIKPSDLFTTNKTFADTDVVKVQAFLKPSKYATIQELLGNVANQLPTQETPQGVWANAQSIDFFDEDAEFDFDLKDASASAEVIFVVTVNGVRASEDYAVDIVSAYNIRDFEEIRDVKYDGNPITGTSSTKEAYVLSWPSQGEATVSISADGRSFSVTVPYYTYSSGSWGKTKITTTPKTYNYTVDGCMGSNIVLLNDISMGASYGDFTGKKPTEKGSYNTLTIPANTTFYGNCYTFNLTNGRIVDEGIIVLNGTIQDTRIIGNLYDKLGLSAGDEYGSSAIISYTGAKIDNCYVSGTRSPLRTNGDTTVNNSVFYGGKYSNINICFGSLFVEGEVITVNQKHDNQVGLGIAVWWSTNADKSKVIIKTDAEGKEIAKLTQYNFISSADTGVMPNIGLSVLAASAGVEFPDALDGAVGINLGDVFNKLITSGTYDHHIFTRGEDKYMNAGVVYISEPVDSTAAVFNHANRYGSTSYTYLPDTELGSIPLAPTVAKKVLKSQTGIETLPIFVNTFIANSQDANGNTVNHEENYAFFNSDTAKNAASIYAPTYGFGADGQIITNGK